MARGARAWSVRDRLAFWLFGPDFFISYTRQDATNYAAELAHQLWEEGYSCAVDLWDTDVSESIPVRLLRRLVRSHVLIVLASPGAADSRHMPAEIAAFHSTRGRIMVVDFEGSYSACPFRQTLPGLPALKESREALRLSLPSSDVVRCLVNSFDYIRRNKRIQISALATLLLMSVGVGSLLGVLGQENNAIRDRISADVAQNEANLDRVSAQRQADRQRAAASANQKLAALAAAEAQKQGRIATARRMIADARSLHADSPQREPEAALLALHAVSLDWTLDADRALREFAGLLRRKVTDLRFQRPLTKVRWSPGGESAAILDDQGNLTLLRTAGADPPSLLPVSGGPVSAFYYETDGSLRMVGRDPAGDIWVATLPAASTLPGAKRTLPDSRNLQLSSDGRYGLTTNSRIIRTVDGSTVMTVDAPQPQLPFEVSPQERFVAVSFGTKPTLVFDASTGKRVSTLGDQFLITALDFSPDGELVATGSRDNTARVYRSRTGEQVGRLDHLKGLRRVAFADDGEYVATASLDQTARLFVSQNGIRDQEVFRIAASAHIGDIAVDRRAQRLAVALESGRLQVYELQGQEGRIVLPVHYGNALAVPYKDHGVDLSAVTIALSPDASRLVLATSLRLGWFDSASGKLLARIDQVSGPVRSIEMSVDGKKVLFANAKGVPVIADFSTGKTATVSGADGEVLAAAMTSDGVQTALGLIDHVVWPDRQRLALKIFAARPPEFGDSESVPITAALSPDGRSLAMFCMSAAKDGGVLQLFDFRSGTHHGYPLSTVARKLVFTPDSRFLTASGDAPETIVIEVSSGRKVAGFAHQGGILTAAFSRDSRLFAVGGIDRTTRIFNWPERRETMRATMPGPVFAVAFRSDGHSFVTASGEITGNGRIIITQHPMEFESLRREVCKTVGAEVRIAGSLFPEGIPNVCLTAAEALNKIRSPGPPWPLQTTASSRPPR
jgi:WD40 repeat protein